MEQAKRLSSHALGYRISELFSQVKIGVAMVPMTIFRDFSGCNWEFMMGWGPYIVDMMIGTNRKA